MSRLSLAPHEIVFCIPAFIDLLVLLLVYILDRLLTLPLCLIPCITMADQRPLLMLLLVFPDTVSLPDPLWYCLPIKDLAS